MKTLFAVITLFVMINASWAVASPLPLQSPHIRGDEGDNNLVKHAEAGEARIAQEYKLAGTGATGPNGETLRGDDPDDPVYDFWTGYWPGPYQQGPSHMTGGGGADEFLIRTYISGKPDVVERNVNADGTIDWSGNGVAGENTYVHDHWVEAFGTVRIKDFDREEGDTIRVQGHTVALKSIRTTNRGTLIVVQSQQGNGGGAHDEDILGSIFVDKVTLTEDDITFTQTDDGIVETWEEFKAEIAYNERVVNWLQGGIQLPAYLGLINGHH